MASVNTSDIPEEQQFMSDFWKFRKHFYGPEEDDDFWSNLVEDANALSKKYGNQNYYNQLILVCIDDIDRRFRQQIGSPYISKDPLKDTYDRLRKART